MKASITLEKTCEGFEFVGYPTWALAPLASLQLAKESEISLLLQGLFALWAWAHPTPLVTLDTDPTFCMHLSFSLYN